MSPRATVATIALAVFAASGLLALVGVGSAGSDPPEPANEKVPSPKAIYHTDQKHLWNRVHAALLMRVGPDGLTYGQDRLEPLLWSESEHLLAGPSATRAVAVLEEFLRENGDALIDDPLKRAVLQRDLWLVASWLAATPASAGRERLEGPLAKVIRRLALTPEQIAKLPDNYAGAVASKAFAVRFDPAKPEQSYLPPDPFKADGPWVCVGVKDGPTAPRHLDTHNPERAVNPFANSTFLVFLRLPDGRDATLDFLKALAAFDKPLYVPVTEKETRSIIPNPALPQMPKGTEIALVRRALLIDSERRIVASPLTESVQLRIVRGAAPPFTPETVEKLDDALAHRTADWQAFGEFQLRRADLFANRTGGLRDVSGERDFKTGFNAHGWDEFTARGNTDKPFPERGQPFKSNRASCIVCHQLPGVYSFNSFHTDFAFARRRVPPGDGEAGFVPKPQVLVPTPVMKVEESAVKWREGRPAWTALRKRLAE